MRENSIPMAVVQENNVVGIVGRKTGLAHRADQAETAKNLHGARRHMVASHTWRLGGCTHLHDCHLDAALDEIDRQCQANWSASDDQHLRIDSIAHAALPTPAPAYRMCGGAKSAIRGSLLQSQSPLAWLNAQVLR